MNEGEPPRVSVIIPYYKNETYLRNCVDHCLNLDYPAYEVIVVGNTPITLDRRVKLVILEETSQGSKKDAGVREASGEICAFVDDDAYPSHEWLRNAIRYFENSEIAAVCGPGITPPEDGLLQKGGGAIFASPIGSGTLRFRYTPLKSRFVNEGPGYNLLIRRSLLLEIAGIGTNFRSGEDTILCEKIRKTKKKILYAPDVIVYHHRRPLLASHLRQVKNYGLHRGFFIRRFGYTRARTIYPFPLWGVGLIAIALFALSRPLFVQIVIVLVIAYLVASFASGLWLCRSVRLATLTAIGTPLTHIAYCMGFVQGLLTKDIGERPSY